MAGEQPELKLRELTDSGEHPALFASQQRCEKSTEGGEIRTSAKKIAGTEIEILHQCGVTPSSARLAIHKATWFVSHGTAIHDFTNMSTPMSRTNFVSELVTAGTLSDGSPAAVFRVDTEDTDVERTAKKIERVLSRERSSHVEVCSLESPRCGDVVIHCPKAGCRPVTLAKGVLSGTDKTGKVSFAVRRDAPRATLMGTRAIVGGHLAITAKSREGPVKVR
ncbi:MAG: hypothetical protein JWO36_3150 [Myxococcales bacterium]|nr:hypothetical protein [Myxococcales bacterium]